MATFTFDGASSQTIAFNPAVDVLNFNVAPAQVRNVQETSTGVVVTLASGAALTLTGATYAGLAARPAAIVGADGGAFLFASSGTVTNGTAASDIVVGSVDGDTIAVGNGNNLVFGGRSNNDSVDAGDNITSGNGNDTIFGNGGGDRITSTSGSDSVIGGAGADTITLSPLTGQTATVFGGGTGVDPNDAADTILIQSETAGLAGGSALVFGNGGNDSITINANGNNTVYGGVGNDTINVGSAGAAGNNLVYGGENNDQITVTSSGNNTVFGGISNADSVDGADTILVTGNGSNLVFGNGGSDLITVNGTGANTIYGGVGADTINVGVGTGTGTAGSLIYGGSESDQITVVNNGANTIFGGTGGTDAADLADVITVTGTGNNLVFGNGGNDNITLNATGSNTVFGGQGNDTITFGNTGLAFDAAARAVVYGGAGSDLINFNGFTGNTTIYGGEGPVDSADAADTIRGGAGSDVIFGNGGNDVISTGAGADSIYGGAGVDRFLVNGGGNKTFFGFETGEQVIGNTGTTAADYTAALSGSNVVLSLGGATPRTLTFSDAQNSVVNVGFTADTFTQANFEAAAPTDAQVTGGRLIASFGSTAQTLTGTAGNDKIYSGAAADTIVLGGGNDTVFAGAGNDTINAGTTLNADDSIDGGLGIDVLNITDGSTLAGVRNVEIVNVSSTSATTLLLGSNDVVASGTTLTINASTTTAGFVFDGTAETDGSFNITGGSGADSITGGSLNDTITGGVGDDTLTGGAGNDSLVGGAGNDSLVGGAGVDTLTGGTGNDVFRFTFGDQGTTLATLDTITDLNLGGASASAADTIGLTTATIAAVGYTIDGAAVGTTAANAATVASLDAAIAVLGTNTAGLFNIGGQTVLVADTGADGSAFAAANDFAVIVTGVTGTLDAADFVA